jgi:fucose 4-O-acetylase-like acetyltransferase
MNGTSMGEAVGARDGRVDSIKGGLMVLVVFGHLLENFNASSPLYLAIYSSIYVFHMPLFVITAGMFSKEFLEPRDYRSIVSRLLIPLVICQMLYFVWTARSGHPDTVILRPHWILWFLLSLILWKLVLPIIVKVRYGMALTVLLALLAGYDPQIGYAFSLSRTVYFLPFFLFGFQYRDRIVAGMSSHRWVKAILLAMILVAMAWWSFNGLTYQALYGSYGYDTAPVLVQAPLAGRAMLLMVSLLAALAASAVLGVQWRALAYLGQRSYSTFILHPLFVMGFGKLHLQPSYMLLPGLLMLSVLVAAMTAFCDPFLSRMIEKASDVFLHRPNHGHPCSAAVAKQQE